MSFIEKTELAVLEQTRRAMKAMLKMKKLDVAGLQQAYRQS